MQHTHPAWQTALKNSITTIDALLRQLDLYAADVGMSESACKSFPLRVPLSFVQRMKKGNPKDPLLRQVLPLQQELVNTPGYTHDPLGEEAVSKAPGLLHKYHGRILLTITGACAINCRYCFRRHFPYSRHGIDSRGWEPAINYIKHNADIQEVILSGGDPLVAKDSHLAALVGRLTTIRHIKRLRIHTRLPIVLPERINDELLAWLRNTPLDKVMVIHCNHPQEVNNNVGNALRKLRQLPVTILNQAVLLKGVNDSADTLIDLNNILFKYGVMPYYLSLLDQVAGAAHFNVTQKEAVTILQELMQRLPGYLVPKLVKEQQGATSKIPINIMA